MEAENRQEGPSQEAFLTGLQFLLAFDAPLPLLWRGGGGPDIAGRLPGCARFLWDAGVRWTR